MESQEGATLVEQKSRKYTLRITRTLINRLNRHLSYLKFVKNKKFSKRSWVLNALREKIENDKNLEIPDIPKRGVILLELENGLAKELETKVKLVRDVRGSYSIKSWMVDAIEEKLERDAAGGRKDKDSADPTD